MKQEQEGPGANDRDERIAEEGEGQKLGKEGEEAAAAGVTPGGGGKVGAVGPPAQQDVIQKPLDAPQGKEDEQDVIKVCSEMPYGWLKRPLFI